MIVCESERECVCVCEREREMHEEADAGVSQRSSTQSAPVVFWCPEFLFSFQVEVAVLLSALPCQSGTKYGRESRSLPGGCGSLPGFGGHRWVDNPPPKTPQNPQNR